MSIRSFQIDTTIKNGYRNIWRLYLCLKNTAEWIVYADKIGRRGELHSGHILLYETADIERSLDD